ncbi:hypothetical protein RJ640_017752 [Escallonia rubra]|uniref:RWP-RK domain-containing protein n=1 Tax=Escallonia rubra TaxID=112253 RepID=A0AA88UIL6_9ASTE|nr:hypothetical protein RJ640_017752 [Escallonia rubra]
MAYRDEPCFTAELRPFANSNWNRTTRLIIVDSEGGPDLVYGTDRGSSIDSDVDLMINVDGIMINLANSSDDNSTDTNSNLYYSAESLISLCLDSGDVADLKVPYDGIYVVAGVGPEDHDVVAAVDGPRGASAVLGLSDEILDKLEPHLLGLALDSCGVTNSDADLDKGNGLCMNNEYGQLLDMLVSPIALDMAHLQSDQALSFIPALSSFNQYGSRFGSFAHGTHDAEAGSDSEQGDVPETHIINPSRKCPPARGLIQSEDPSPMTNAQQVQAQAQLQNLSSATAQAPPPSFDQVSKLFSIPLSEAADSLVCVAGTNLKNSADVKNFHVAGVSAGVLKKICQENGLLRWPHRKVGFRCVLLTVFQKCVRLQES